MLKGALLVNPEYTDQSRCITKNCPHPPKWIWEYKTERAPCCKNETCRMTALKMVVDKVEQPNGNFMFFTSYSNNLVELSDPGANYDDYESYFETVEDPRDLFEI
jgi:hypothetical protein